MNRINFIKINIMKNLISSIAFLLILNVATAQDNPNQNPNYKQSMEVYMKQKNGFQSTMNTTVQNTYKAFDWYQNKQEKRQERINFRHQIRFARASAPVYSYYPFNNQNYYSNQHNWRYRQNNNCWCWF